MNGEHRISRRHFFVRTAFAGAAALVGGLASRGRAQDRITLPFANGERELVQFPQKRKLILLTHRPPQLETPFAVFNGSVITPNDAFFVRYHLANIPLEIDPAAFRLEVKGLVRSPLSLSLENLRKDFEAVEMIAVNQCSGNSRGFFNPRVGGGQLGNGAMGNAMWRGARLKDVLQKAGVQAKAKQVICDGLDKPALERFNVRSFITSLADGAQVPAQGETHIYGIAFDGGSGISEVLFSSDGGKGWRAAELGRDLGRYSFRQWKIPFTPPASGAFELKCRAINRVGESQPLEPKWNPAGYMRNVVETVKVNAA